MPEPGPHIPTVEPTLSPEGERFSDRKRSIVSPLRYPGGKRRLVPYVAAALETNGLRPDLLVEPFAGGASVSLELAQAGKVGRIGVADLDPYVADFWQAAFFDCDWLCDRVANVEVTLDEWRRLKETDWKRPRDRALACLLLNRTSFNGSLNRRAGPIGGKKQRSDYDIACRFPRDRLTARLRACEQIAKDGKVAFVLCVPALDVIRIARSFAKIDGESLFF